MAYPDPPTTPPIPQRGDRATFSSRVDAFLTWVAAIIPWLQGFIADFKANLTALAAGGANSFNYRFDAATAVADPGQGFFRLNSSSQSSASRWVIDSLDRSGVDISSALAAIASATSSIKGTVRLQRLNDPTAWLLFDITGFTVATGYYNFTLAPRAASSTTPFAAGDSIMVFVERNGDRGDSGSTGYAQFSDMKAAGTPGGSSVTGLQDRVLNTANFNDISGAVLSVNAVTIPAGSYEVEISAPAYNTGNHYLQLFNVTDNVVVKYGPMVNVVTEERAILKFKFSITSPKAFKVQHYTYSSTSTNGLGLGNALSPNLNIYTELIFRKTA